MANSSGDIINWSLSAQIPGGPTMAASDKLGIDSYSLTDITVPKGNKNVTVDLQPGSGVSLLLIKAMDNGSYNFLTYKLDGQGDPIKLDGPLMLIGSSTALVTKLWTKNIVFTNSADTKGSDATVSVLIGRISSGKTQV